MNFFLHKPYSLLFYSTMLLGIFISLCSNNWLSVWMGLELNLYSFIPLLLQSNQNQEKEGAIKYFLIQALASALFLLAIMLSDYYLFFTFFLTSLMMKLGLAPCHFWLPAVMAALSWKMCWLLTTIQKITPLFLITQTASLNNPSVMSLIAALSGLMGGIGGLNQTQMRLILAYSSIGHLGWMIAGSMISLSITIFYFISYMLIISSIFQLLLLSHPSSSSPITTLSSLTPHKMYLNYMLLSLGGMPPFLGFFPKLLIIVSLLKNNIIILPYILILASTLNLFYYLKIIFSTYLQSPFMMISYFNLNLHKSLIYTTLFILSLFLGIFFILLFF